MYVEEYKNLPKTRVCPRCTRRKSINRFISGKVVQGYCRPCGRAYHAEWQANAAANDPTFVSRRKKWQKEYYDRTPRQRERSRLAMCIKHLLESASTWGIWVDNVGCTAQELRAHLQKHFEPGMTWENRGKAGGWRVGFVKDPNDYDLSDPEQFKTAAHYTNLRPRPLVLGRPRIYR